jgi:Uma2 family endonuclease
VPLEQSMATIVNFENTFEMPLALQTLADFRRWSHSDQFPQTGRIDYLDGRIEVDMSPEDLFTHGAPKGDIFAALYQQVKRRKLGHLFVDRTRIASVAAELSAEPDIVFVSRQAINSDRVRLVPKASGEPGRYVELEGPVDLVVEIVSDSSKTKDTQRLPISYFRAEVEEFWLVDVRGDSVIFQIHRRGGSGYEPVEADADGFQRSDVLDRTFHLVRTRNEDGFWEFELQVQGEPSE